jgi:hypothetical protein
MGFVLLDDGLLLLTIKYLEPRRGGGFRYQRRIPKD